MITFTRPNLFDLAPTELAQDAAIGWLLAWADARAAAVDPALHGAGYALLAALFDRAGITLPGPTTVEVTAQWPRRDRGKTGAIDLIAVVGDAYVLAIEDKTSTSEHSGQLARYADALARHFAERTRAHIYLKTGDQSSYKSIADAKWHAFLRPDILRALRPHGDIGHSEIFRDFMGRLQRIEDDVQSWRATPIVPRRAWTDRAWSGFFMALQDALGEGEWANVPNPSGGFMGFWWAWTPVEGGRVYVQLEETALVAKVACTADRGALRERWSRVLLGQLSSTNPRFRRPERMGLGDYMTVAKAVSHDYRVARANGTIDFEATVVFLRRAAELIRTIATAGATAVR